MKTSGVTVTALRLLSMILIGCSGRSGNSEVQKNDTAVALLTDTVSPVIMLARISTDLRDSIKYSSFSGNRDEDFRKIFLYLEKGAERMYDLYLRFGQDSTLRREAGEIIQRVKNDSLDLPTYRTSNFDTQYHHSAIQMLDSVLSRGYAMHGVYFEEDFAGMMIQHHKIADQLLLLYLRTGPPVAIRQTVARYIRQNRTDINKLQQLTDKFNAKHASDTLQNR